MKLLSVEESTRLIQPVPNFSQLRNFSAMVGEFTEAQVAVLEAGFSAATVSSSNRGRFIKDKDIFNAVEILIKKNKSTQSIADFLNCSTATVYAVRRQNEEKKPVVKKTTGVFPSLTAYMLKKFNSLAAGDNKILGSEKSNVLLKYAPRLTESELEGIISTNGKCSYSFEYGIVERLMGEQGTLSRGFNQCLAQFTGTHPITITKWKTGMVKSNTPAKVVAAPLVEEAPAPSLVGQTFEFNGRRVTITNIKGPTTITTACGTTVTIG